MKFEDVKVGMEVRCIDDSKHKGGGVKGLTKGMIYTVVSLHYGEIRLEEIDLNWLIERFEPVTPVHKFHVGQPVRCVEGSINQSLKDWASESVKGTANGQWKWEHNKGVVKMENISMDKVKELAEQMKDEYVGYDKNRNVGKYTTSTIFLKKAGECRIERRDVTMTLTDDDIKSLLKAKGMAKALGTFEIESYTGTYTVGIVKIIPIEQDKPMNEAD